MEASMSGNLALLALPEDQRLHVQLSMYFYASTLAKLRRDIDGNRTGLALVEVAAPINAPKISVAIDRRSTYVLAFRTLTGRNWWAFKEPDKPLPVLPGAPVRTIGLTGSYTELGLPPSINMRPEELLNQLASYGGSPDPRFCQAVVLLLFLMAEAVRFDDVWMECVRFFAVGAGSGYTIHPAKFETAVRNWKVALPSDRNVLLRYLAPCGTDRPKAP
jgi:hypothetical protein